MPVPEIGCGPWLVSDFQGGQGVTPGPEGPDAIFGGVDVRPGDGILRPKRGLVHASVGTMGRESGQVNMLECQGIGGSQHGPDIESRTNVLCHEADRVSY